MEKSEILKIFLDRGSQVNRGALDRLAADEKVLKKTLKVEAKDLPTVITKEFLSSLSPTYEKLSVVQFSKVLRHRYEFIKNLLLDKMASGVISINKISEKTKNFSVVGLVIDKNGVVTLEDSTGRATFKIRDERLENIVEDEVVGIVCSRKNGENLINEIVFPDIPLRKSYTKGTSPRNAIFIFGTVNEKQTTKIINKMKNASETTIFILGEKNQLALNATSSNNVQTITLQNHSAKMDIDGMKILVVDGHVLDQYKYIWKNFDERIINLLKKRNLNPVISSQSYDDKFLLESVPDIIIVTGAEDSMSINYKGVTILTMENINTKPIYWVINLQTRETFKTDMP